MVKYSRLLATEEKRNLRRAFVFLLLTGAFIVGLIFFGLPTLAKFAAFLTDLRKSSQPVEKNDITPPAPPRFNEIPEATNIKELEIKGATEPGAAVILSINERESEVVANSDGEFSFSVSLKKGENVIVGSAKDAAGNQSQKSQTYTILFDDEEPKLEISTPADGKEFFGTKERQVTIDGIAEAESALTINDRVVRVEDNGNFTFATLLSEGDNTFNFKVIDKAGNVTEKSLTVKFSP